MWYEIYKWYDSYIPYFNLYFTNINYIIYMRNFAGNATANRSQVSALSQLQSELSYSSHSAALALQPMRLWIGYLSMNVWRM